MRILQLTLYILHLSILYIIPWEHLFPTSLHISGFYPIRCAIFEEKNYKLNSDIMVKNEFKEIILKDFDLLSDVKIDIFP